MVDFRRWPHTNTFSHERFRWLRKPTPDLFRIAVVGAADYANSADLVCDVALGNCRGYSESETRPGSELSPQTPDESHNRSGWTSIPVCAVRTLGFDIPNQRLRPPLRGQRFLELAEFA